MDLSVIAPCHNEEENVKLFYDLCSKTFKGLKVEYIFIDDGSKDNTWSEIKNLTKENKNIVSIRFSRNFGKEAAMLAGLRKATGKYCCFIDTDLQQHPKYVVEMLEFLKNNPDFDSAACYPKKRKDSKALAFVKGVFYKLINKISDVPLYENASDFRVFKSEVKDAILALPEYYRFSKGIFSWIGFNTHYMEYEVEERIHGTSSWSVKALFKYAFDGIIGFSVSPLKIATVTGLFTFIASIIAIIVVIIQKLFIGIHVSGYATIVCLILLFGGLQMIFIGIIGEYLGRTYVETKKRPAYIVKEELSSKEGRK